MMRVSIGPWSPSRHSGSDPLAVPTALAEGSVCVRPRRRRIISSAASAWIRKACRECAERGLAW